MGKVEIGIRLQCGHYFQMDCNSMLMSDSGLLTKTGSRSGGFCPPQNLVGNVPTWNSKCSSKQSRQDCVTILLEWPYSSTFKYE